MSVRHVALGVGTALVLAVGVYLFIEVRASPARAAGSSGRHDRDGASADVASDDGHATGTPRPTLASPTAAARTPAGPLTPMDKQRMLHSPPAAADGEDGAAGGASDTDAEGSGRRPFALKRPGPNKSLDVKGDEIMLEANKAYDRGDIDEAKEIAARVLAKDPKNARMNRIMVSVACMDSDQATAQQYYASLTKGDQAQMRTRCARYGVTFPDAAP